MKKLDHITLGATLFVPASHRALEDIVLHNKYPKLKSLVIDFEDGLNQELFAQSWDSVCALLQECSHTDFALFLRPRDVETLELFLSCKDISKIDGFVLPKCTLERVDGYIHALKDTKHYYMPSIEGEELFDEQKLTLLRDKLLGSKERILTIRYGLEDMLKALGMRRNCEQSAFDISVCSFVLARLIAIFKPHGFSVSGGVFPCFENKEAFIRDAQRDLDEGLFGKTIIHPKQIAWANEVYAVEQQELDEARKILNCIDNVFNLNGKMGEKITMHPHAISIIKRHEIFGLKENYEIISKERKG